MEAVEDVQATTSGAHAPQSRSRHGYSTGGKSERSVANQSHSPSSARTAECILRLTGPTTSLATGLTAEPPCADPHARWCGRGRAARLPPIPIGEDASAPFALRASVHQ